MERIEDDEHGESDRAMFGKANLNCCFFSFPSFRSIGGDSSSSSTSSGRWWRKVLVPVTKVRAWSELVAGPRWKTFIRRFNHQRPRNPNQRFHYDPLSYALNFDDGINEDDDFDPDRRNEDRPLPLNRGFSARFAVPTPSYAAGDSPNR